MTLSDMLKLTGKRQPSFTLMMEHLSKYTNPVIIETGCAREENSFDSNGMSTLIFDEYVKNNGGEFYSVDIDPTNTNFARSRTDVARITTGDSVKFLFEFNEQNKKVDLLYLDSFDIDPNNPHPSSLHHILELAAIRPSLKEGTMICVDDNWVHNNQASGKGIYIYQFMTLIGKPKVYNGYQWIWIL